MQHQQSRILWSPRRQGDTWEENNAEFFLLYWGEENSVQGVAYFILPAFVLGEKKNVCEQSQNEVKITPKGWKTWYWCTLSYWRTIKRCVGLVFATLEWNCWQIEHAPGTCEQISWLIRWDNLTHRWPADMCHSNEVAAWISVSERTTLTTNMTKVKKTFHYYVFIFLQFFVEVNWMSQLIFAFIQLVYFCLYGFPTYMYDSIYIKTFEHLQKGGLRPINIIYTNKQISHTQAIYILCICRHIKAHSCPSFFFFARTFH